MYWLRIVAMSVVTMYAKSGHSLYTMTLEPSAMRLPIRLLVIGKMLDITNPKS